MACRAAAALVAVALIAAATACSGGDKAGGGRESGEQLVLTLEGEDTTSLSGAPEFAEAVERLSRGSIRIELVRAGRGREVEFERGVVEDVRAGKADLGIVGIRAWDTLGVTSFQALLAPLLVDSLELQRRVLASSLSDAMLAGVERAGVVGIALLPGSLRLPLGFTRALVRPDDYRRATVGIRPAGLATTTLRALGARAKSYVAGDVSGLDGAELDPVTIGYNGLDQERGWLTTNVVLWPKPYSIVMNRRAFASLTSSQRQLLRRAGREAAVPEERQIARDAAGAFARACSAAKLSFVTASAGDLAALRAAVQPVYDELRRDAETRRFLERIVDLSAGGSPAPDDVRCGATAGAAASHTALEGTWKLSRGTKQELIAAGVDPPNAEALSTLPGTPALVFDEGRHRGIDLETGEVLSTGTYEVEGDVVRFVFESGVAVDFGRVYSLRWSVYRDTLTLAELPGHEPLIALVLRPWKRVR